MTSDYVKREFTLEELARAAQRQMTVSRIVIADDDPDSLELLRLALGNPLIEICEATNGAELVQLLADDGPFDLVITDIHMPWMEGLQVLHSARAAEVKAPVLVITGLPGTDLQAKVDRLGNAKLLRKPFGIPELRAAVAELMAGRAVA
ncbi:MAG: response regulator [Polyangia bacterium]|jgi:ATP-dependent Lon protease